MQLKHLAEKDDVISKLREQVDEEETTIKQLKSQQLQQEQEIKHL